MVILCHTLSVPSALKLRQDDCDFFAMEINKFDESARVMIEIVRRFFFDQVQNRPSVDR